MVPPLAAAYASASASSAAVNARISSGRSGTRTSSVRSSMAAGRRLGGWWLLGALGSVTRSLWWIGVTQRSPALRYWRSSAVNVGRVHRGRIERASAALWVVSTGSVLMLIYMLRG